VLAERVAGEQRRGTAGRHRVPDVGLYGVQGGQARVVAVGDAVDQAQEDLGGCHQRLLNEVMTPNIGSVNFGYNRIAPASVSYAVRDEGGWAGAS
jgi:hypothetical protein